MSEPRPASPPPRREALRKLRLRVPVALMVAAAACAYVANKASGDELRGSYRETGQQVLATVSEEFQIHVRPGDLRNPQALESKIERLPRLHPELRWVGLYEAEGRQVSLAASTGRGANVRSSGSAARRAVSRGRAVESEVDEGKLHMAVRAVPLKEGGRTVAALELGFDLGASDFALAERNRTILLVLCGLLLAFTLFTAAVLDRGIFRPLDRLRVATNRMGSGDLATRLGWRRRDELGVLARDFDEMAEGLQQSHRRLEALAHEDPLTGLSNHRHFQERLQEEIALATAEDGRVALVIVDIDRFKRVNDARGHPFGDLVLKGVGERLRGALAGIGSAARLGGDEFAVVLPGADRQQAAALCEAARAAVASFSPSDYDLSCSAGIACFPDDARNATDLVQLADGALYWAKSSGRDRARMYDPEHVLVVTEEQRAEFGSLLERPAAVRPVFQPLVSLQTGEVVGYEALARFDDSRNLPPTWWFEQAHRFGLGARLEAEAVRVAIAEPGRPEGVFLTVNLSPSALRSEEVRAVLPHDLTGIVIEITEQEEILQDDNLQAALAPLRERGARVAVDDAGAGYAGLQQVMRMQADVIKLDRSLVQDVHKDAVKAALVRSLVHFAADTNAELCAEGIENLDELTTLVALGVSMAQGYVLARPAPPWASVSEAAAAVCQGAPSVLPGLVRG